MMVPTNVYSTTVRERERLFTKPEMEAAQGVRRLKARLGGASNSGFVNKCSRSLTVVE